METRDENKAGSSARPSTKNTKQHASKDIMFIDRGGLFTAETQRTQRGRRVNHCHLSARSLRFLRLCGELTSAFQKFTVQLRLSVYFQCNRIEFLVTMSC